MKKVILILSIFLCLSANEKLKKECDKGNAKSCYQLAEFYNKKGTIATKEGQKYIPLATEYYTRACDLGMQKSCKIMGERLLAFGVFFIQGEVPEAEAMLRAGCDKYKNADSCAVLGDLFRTGHIVKKNIVEAEHYLRKSCKAKSGAGCTSLSMLYDIEKKDPFKAFDYSTMACELYDSDGCGLLGLAYVLGNGVPQDTHQGLYYLIKSCDMQNAKGCNGAGVVLRGLNNDEEAKAYFKRSCELKYQEGCSNYAKMNF